MVAPIVFIGDSITELWGLHRAETFATCDLIPRGASGQTARLDRHALPPRPGGDRGAGRASPVRRHDIGRNEGVFVPAEEIARILASMLDEARAMGVRAWVGSIMPAASIPWNPEVRDAPAMIAAVNAWLREHATSTGRPSSTTTRCSRRRPGRCAGGTAPTACTSARRATPRSSR